MPVPMANPAPSSFSSSPASSLSSAASAWSSSLSHPHYHQNAPPAMNQANTSSSSRPAAPLPATPSIASLPSLAHSLSSFPTMTVVTNDMVHYGTLVRTKDASDKVRPPHPSLRVASLLVPRRVCSLAWTTTSEVQVVAGARNTLEPRTSSRHTVPGARVDTINGSFLVC